MSVSPEQFEAFVRAAAAHHSRIVNVTVDNFTFVLRVKPRRVPYNVVGEYDPATGQWSGADPYNGNLLRFVINEVADAIEADGRP